MSRPRSVLFEADLSSSIEKSKETVPPPRDSGKEDIREQLERVYQELAKLEALL